MYRSLQCSFQIAAEIAGEDVLHRSLGQAPAEHGIIESGHILNAGNAAGQLGDTVKIRTEAEILLRTQFEEVQGVIHDGIDAALPTQKVRAGEVHGFYDGDVETLLEYYKPIKAAADKCGIAFPQAHG